MVDLATLRRVANNVRAAYYGDNCVEAQYIDLAADEITQLRKVNKDMYEALKEVLEDIRITEAFESNSFGELTRMVEQALARAEGRTDQ